MTMLAVHGYHREDEFGVLSFNVAGCPLKVDDPVASGWDIVSGSIQEFKNQFITT
jgi:hypothetical protein